MAQFENTRELVKACIADPELLSEITNKVADRFQSELQVSLDERELIAVDYSNSVVMKDGDCCATHEFLDANMPMEESVGAVVRSYAPGESGTAFTRLLDDEFDIAEACSSIWGGAWDIAKKRGFSEFWSRREAIDDDVAFRVLAFALHKRPDRTGARYRSEDIRLTDELFPPFPPFICIDEIDEVADQLVDIMDSIDDGELRELAQAVSRRFADEDGAGLLSCLAVPVERQNDGPSKR